MISLDSATVFFAASALLALAPGPDNIFVLTLSAMHGRRAGLLVTLGLCTGLIGHTFAVTIGVAALFQTSAVAFTALKIAGACYLLYLAWDAFRASATPLQAEANEKVEGWRLYRKGIVMNLTNPKVSIFFLAFLPQFADASRGPVGLQILMLGLLFNLLGTTVNVVVALAASFAGGRFRSRVGDSAALRWLTGCVLVGLGVRLALLERR
jgi:threonine/homoserine/homoserine lactone efflux protein